MTPPTARLRPVDLARAASVSTQHVRNLEASGVIPEAARTPSGYRVYAEQHRSALLCYLALAAGHGSPTARAVMQAVHTADLSLVLERINRSHAGLDRARELILATDKALRAIAQEPILDVRPDDNMRIGELAEAIGVRASTLRSWERLGLIHPARGASDGYRSYTPVDVRTVRVVHQLRLAQYRPAQITDVLGELANAGDRTALRRVLARRMAAVEQQTLLALRGDARLIGYLDAYGPTESRLLLDR